MKKNKSKVLVGGCFDILHIGHIKFLEKAKSLGDILIVALEPDKKVKWLKGKNRPIYNEEMRKKMLLSLKSVDKVTILPYLKTDNDYKSFVMNLKPDIIAATIGDPVSKQKMLQAKLLGAKFVTIAKFKSTTTTQIISKLKNENN